MSKFSKQMRKIPKDRKTLRNYYLFFSAIWAAGIFAYASGYWRMISNMGGHMSFMQTMFFIVVILTPLLVIWFPYWLTKNMRFEAYQAANGTGVASLDPAQLREISTRLEALSSENKEVRLALGDIMSTVTSVSQGRGSVSETAQKRSEARLNMDTPNLPLTERSGDRAEIELGDMATALNFSDIVQQGDWANAFEKVQVKGSYLELMRNAEGVINVLEDEGVFVEDIAVNLPGESAWRAFAAGKRNIETEKLASIKDRSAQALIRARIKNDDVFKELSLRFQKRFIDMIEAMSPTALGEEFDALAHSRAGRAFAILGDISGTFAPKADN